MSDCSEHTAITPETKVARLLEEYPQLEEKLIQLAPAFAKLRNPLLRRTVAKVTTLRQAAKVGNIPLATLVNSLRAEVGQSTEDIAVEETGSDKAEAPEWFDESKIVERLDARAMIERGEQPMGTVMSGLSRLNPGEIYELTTGFVPAPLIDLAVKQGFSSFHCTETADIVRVYFRKSD